MTIVPPGYKETVAFAGQRSVSTLSGDIRLEQNRGRMVIYDPVSLKEISITDRSGYYITDGLVSTKINPGNIVQNDGYNNRILLGNDGL